MVCRRQRQDMTAASLAAKPRVRVSYHLAGTLVACADVLIIIAMSIIGGGAYQVATADQFVATVETITGRKVRAFASATDPAWYKDAIIYELHVKCFCDSNNDGVGDFPGLTRKLDYLQTLGITCIWLLPFYPSPLRDDGYDIAWYQGIHPAYGTLRDFRTFVEEAHRRDLHVLTELVVNHTSDEHPWFRAARRSPEKPATGPIPWTRLLPRRNW